MRTDGQTDSRFWKLVYKRAYQCVHLETVSFCEGVSERIRNLPGSLYGIAVHKDYIAQKGAM
jgi:hypothetical protein